MIEALAKTVDSGNRIISIVINLHTWRVHDVSVYGTNKHVLFKVFRKLPSGSLRVYRCIAGGFRWTVKLVVNLFPTKIAKDWLQVKHNTVPEEASIRITAWGAQLASISGARYSKKKKQLSRTQVDIYYMTQLCQVRIR